MAAAPASPPIKCFQTGHFFAYVPELDVGFNCFECLGEFGPSGQRPLVYAGNSRKRRSLAPALPPPTAPPPTEISEHDDMGRRRSKPWRCLQIRCRLIACDTCSTNLINPTFPSRAKERGHPDQGMPPPVAADNQARSKTVRSHRRVRGDDQEQDGAGDPAQKGGERTTPPERAAGGKDAESQRPSRVPGIDNPIGEVKPTDDKASDKGSDDEIDIMSLRSHLSYRRATNMGTNLVYNHRPPTRPSRNTSLDTTGNTATDFGKSRLIAPAPPPQPNPSSAIPLQPVPVTGYIQPEPLTTAPPARKAQVPVLEVASDVDDMDELEFLPKLPVRSAAQAAKGAILNTQMKYNKHRSGDSEHRSGGDRI